MFFRFLVIAVVLAGCLSVSFCSKAKPEYIFLITLDTTRADHVNYSLENNNQTPNLARLAADGVRYNNAFSLIPITLPSHAAMFYSLPPHQLKIYNNQQFCEVPRQSLAQVMKKNGYATGAVISLGVLEKIFGLHHGFDQYFENFRKGVWYKYGEEVNRDTFEMLKGNSPKKGFYWIHYSDPHGPYYTPEYRGGKFTAALNGNTVFTCDAIDQMTVDVEVELKPGRNLLNLKTRLPRKIRENKDVIVGLISYMDFNPNPDRLPENLEMKVPIDWFKFSFRGDTNFNCQHRRSRVYFTNKSGKPMKVRLSFVYKIIESSSSSRALYKEEMIYMDRCIGELMDFLKKKGIYDRSAFIIYGDHAEGLGEHKELVGHEHYLNRIYTQVPLILSGVGFPKGEVSDHVASNLNIAPTIFQLAGIGKPDYMLGDSLLSPGKEKKLLLETYAPEAYHDGFSLISYPHQIIHYPDRDTEKLEYIDLSDRGDLLGIDDKLDQKENQQIKTRLRNEIVKLARSLQKLKQKSGKKVSEKHKEILKSLGYL